MRSDWFSCDGIGGTRLTRRSLLLGASAGAVSWITARSAIAQLAIRSGKNVEGETLVVIFLRGGADGLNVVPPYREDAYHRIRPSLGLAKPNDLASPSVDRALDLDGFFGLHPALDTLLPLFRDGKLGIVHAVGSNDETRSHFEAMNAMERGLPEQREGDASGWLARHLTTVPRGDASPLRAVAFGSTMPDSLRGATGAIALQSLEEFRITSRDDQRSAWLESSLRKAYAKGDDEMTRAGRSTLSVLDTLNRFDPRAYRPSGAASYPDTELGNALRQVAFLIKAGLGLEVACLDKGGWDTHVAQGRGQGWLASLLDDLGRSMSAFHSDLGARMRHVTVVVQTEFGRRAYENTGLGTDHGHGSVMFLLGGGTVGGKVHGRWPGLEADALAGTGDLAVTTDYRNVLAEVLTKRLGNPRVEEVFPGLQPPMPGWTG